MAQMRGKMGMYAKAATGSQVTARVVIIRSKSSSAHAAISVFGCTCRYPDAMHFLITLLVIVARFRSKSIYVKVY